MFFDMLRNNNDVFFIFLKHQKKNTNFLFIF